MKTLIKQILSPFFRLVADRKYGLRQEVAYWDKWISTQGGRTPEAYRKRLDPNWEIDGLCALAIDRIGKRCIRIIDVGAGPLTSIGKKYKDYHIEIVAVDPLADEYDLILNRYNLNPPVRTIKCWGESLRTEFGDESFDIVVAVNSLDHSENPLEIFSQMFYLCRFNGYLVLSHYENEARKEGYRGLHQWNFSLNEFKLALEGKGRIVMIDDLYKGKLDFLHIQEGRWIRSLARKLPLAQ